MNASSVIGSLLGGGALSGLGSLLMKDGKPDMKDGKPDPDHPATAQPNSYKDGGKVQKTGVALVHKGEVVIPAKEKDSDKKETVHLSHHRVVMHLNRGGLHRALGVPEGTKIPDEKIAAARNSDNPHLKAMANLAHTFAGFHHGE